jgi:two-component system, NtrC family, sensor kinase
MLYRNMKHKQEANEILVKQKMEIESTLAELKVTQQQLIQSEKMASLGELTAGIAHEIQNPLNFVNNFAEINAELIAELNEIRQKPDKDLALEEQLLKDIAENSSKISHHGKRADGIVKGMLQHSRTSNGLKEPTDINVLADEYLRLAYHGLRAKDKTFNATIKTDFDESIGKVSLVPQDIGRVILNLITNAFYAVGERKKTNANFDPVVSVSTKRILPSGSKGQPKIEIKISDNGNGIPQHLIDRIFQPFFTTKPTGQGTGLGLSLSYDIVKAHGGNLTVNTVHAESSGGETPGTTFVVELPTINPSHI